MASCDLPSSSSASSLPITSNPEDGPSAPSATVTKKRKHYDKTFKLKVIMFAEKFSNREAEGIDRALEYNAPSNTTPASSSLETNRTRAF